MPYFVGVPDEDRLDHSDAIFVDVIHTAGRKTLPISNYPWSLAFLEPMGHVDFYPNNGKAVQPGCSFYDVIGSKIVFELNTKHYCKISVIFSHM